MDSLEPNSACLFLPSWLFLDGFFVYGVSFGSFFLEGFCFWGEINPQIIWCVLLLLLLLLLLPPPPPPSSSSSSYFFRCLVLFLLEGVVFLGGEKSLHHMSLLFCWLAEGCFAPPQQLKAIWGLEPDRLTARGEVYVFV